MGCARVKSRLSFAESRVHVCSFLLFYIKDGEWRHVQFIYTRSHSLQWTWCTTQPRRHLRNKTMMRQWKTHTNWPMSSCEGTLFKWRQTHKIYKIYKRICKPFAIVRLYEYNQLFFMSSWQKVFRLRRQCKTFEVSEYGFRILSCFPPAWLVRCKRKIPLIESACTRCISLKSNL